MFEKVNPAHPDKVADRIAGAIVDLAYKIEENPKVAVEVLIGHGTCNIITESSVDFNFEDIQDIVFRLAGPLSINLDDVKQDEHLAENQNSGFRCGDNGIFKAVPTSHEEKYLTEIAQQIYKEYPYDGKYIYDQNTGRLIICQSHSTINEILKIVKTDPRDVNPIGYWTGGTSVDSGATNRKLGSDMGRCVTGGGINGKDLSKADVSVNIYCYLQAQKKNCKVEALCAIGDKQVIVNWSTEFGEHIDTRLVDYVEIVRIAREYIIRIGGFEKFAEWGLINNIDWLNN